eukprot:m51a1_g14544 putative acyl- -binding protein (461) ;mRNA; r:976795-978269
MGCGASVTAVAPSDGPEPQGAERVPLVLACSSFTGCFVSAELARTVRGPVYLVSRSASPAAAAKRFLETLRHYGAPGLSDRDLAKCKFVCGDVQKDALDSLVPGGVTDVFDFALTVHYLSTAAEMERQWLPVTQRLADLCARRRIRLHYPGSIIRHLAPDSDAGGPSPVPREGGGESGVDLWRGGYASFKALAHRVLAQKKESSGLRLVYYDLPFVLGQTGVGRCPENYVTLALARETLKGGEVPDGIRMGFITSDALAMTMVQNMLRPQPVDYLRTIQEPVITSEDIRRARELEDSRGRNVFRVEGYQRDESLVPEEVRKLVDSIELGPVGPVVVPPGCSIVEEFLRHVDVYLDGVQHWTPEFACATEEIKKLSKKPGNSELLGAYSLYKQATAGDCDGEKPSGHAPAAKWGAWKKLSGMSGEDAMREYCQLVQSLKSKYGLAKGSHDIQQPKPSTVEP